MSATATLILAILTVVATLLSPLIAVEVTRWRDERRERRARWLEVFRLLMGSRRMLLSPDWVRGLNLIEVEFYDRPEIIAAWKALLDNYSKRAKDDGEAAGLMTERRLREAILLDSIAKAIGVNIPQLDIFHGGYHPEGWRLVEDDQAAVRAFLKDLAAGKAVFPVVVVNSAAQMSNDPPITAKETGATPGVPPVDPAQPRALRRSPYAIGH